ncbi:MAG: cell wall biogenesis protein [Acaryochloris sp. SU_5_25]|nr:cell wall biogenesis protein [Acaryochloris sp. SU_5_25]
MKVYPRIELDITFKDLSANLLSYFSWSEREEIISQIQSFWHTQKQTLVTLCVRTSLDLLLQALNLPPGSEIIMSAVNIAHMEEIIKKHNCIPVPVDIDLETLAPSVDLFKSSISSRSRVFILAHLFGSIIPLDPYVEICKSHNILLVEDCAQAFDGLRYLGHPEADISFFSFGSIKSCTALGGSITLVQDKQLAQKMYNIEQTYPIKNEVWFFKRLLKYLCFKFLAIPKIFGIFVTCLDCLKIDLDHFISSLTRGFNKGNIQSQLRYRPPKGMLRLLQYRFKHLDSSRYDQRQQTAHQFLALLDKPDSYPGRKAMQHSYWLVPFVTANPKLLMQKLRIEGFDTTTGTTSLTALGEDSAQAKTLISTVLYLPIYPSVPTPEMTRLAQFVRLYSNGSEIRVCELAKALKISRADTTHPRAISLLPEKIYKPCNAVEFFGEASI